MMPGTGLNSRNPLYLPALSRAMNGMASTGLLLLAGWRLGMVPIPDSSGHAIVEPVSLAHPSSWSLMRDVPTI